MADTDIPATLAPTTEEEGEEAIIITWNSIWVTTVVAFAQTVVFYGIFMHLRKKASKENSFDLYEPRQNTRSHRSPQPFADSWWKAAWEVPQEELLRCVGLDSYMFLRFLRMSARTAALGVIFAIILIPCYATGGATGNETVAFNQLTLARVEPNSNRLFAAVVTWWIFTSFILYEFVTEWKLFAKARYDFLATGDPDTDKEFRYAVSVENIPPNLRESSKLSDYFERIFPGKVRAAIVYWDVSDLDTLISGRQTAIEACEAVMALQHAKQDEAFEVKIKGEGALGMGGRKVDSASAVTYYKSLITRLNEEIDKLRAKLLAKGSNRSLPDGDTEAEQATRDDNSFCSSTGVVTFTSLRSKQAAVQCEMSGKYENITTSQAADPQGILWKNVTMPLGKQNLLKVQTAAVWIPGLLFWAVPVGFVSGLANLNSILKAFGIDEVDSTQAWYGLVAGLLPVIFLAILMAVLYMAIVGAATHWIRFKSAAEVDGYTLQWHQLFQFANLWLLLIGGSFFNKADEILSDISSLVNIIADALPGGSVLFVNMLTVGGLGSFGMELSLLPTYGVALIMNIIQPEATRTQRMLDASKTPPALLWGKVLPPMVFAYVVTLMYMPIVPLIEVYSLVYFGGAYLVFKHQCLHVYAQEFESGGVTTWEVLFGFLIVCLYMSEGIFIAYMGIKESPVASGCGFVPLIITVFVHQILINRNIRGPLKNLSLEVAADIDIANGELEKSSSKASNSVISLDDQLYAQPALRECLDEREPMPYRRDLAATSMEMEG